MAGRGPAPKDPSERRNRHAPIRGELKATEGAGWQHGEVPEPPDGMLKGSRDAWAAWFTAWFAAHWGPEDLPGLRLVALLYDQALRGEFTKASELRQQMDTYGITPKGQQDRRWKRPEASRPTEAVVRKASGASRYEHLKVVADAVEGT